MEVALGDIRDSVAVGAACRDIETVFHSAAVAGIWGPWKLFYETNTLGTRHVVDGCLAQGVQRLVFTSSPSVTVRWARSMRRRRKCTPTPCAGWLTTHTRRPWQNRSCLPRTAKRPVNLCLAAASDLGSWRSTPYSAAVGKPAPRSTAAGGRRDKPDRHHLRRKCSGGAPAGGRRTWARLAGLWKSVLFESGRAGQLLGVDRRRSCSCRSAQPVDGHISLRTAYVAGVVLEQVYRLFRLRGEPRMTRFVALQLGRSRTISTFRSARRHIWIPAASFDGRRDGAA